MSSPNIIELDSVRRDHENSNSDDKRNRTKQARLAADRKKRYMKVAQVDVPVGVTNMDAKDGPGQLVFYVADRHTNVYARRAKGQTCSEKHIIFKSPFDSNEERQRAVTKWAEAFALQALELHGRMTTAEAVMADRHKGAFQNALKLASTKNFYPRAVPYPKDYINDPKALGVLDRYNDTYGQNVSKELMAHAYAFYSIWRDEFPKRFDAVTHLDYYVAWYKSQVHVQRHNTKPQLDNTIRQLSPEMILGSINEALDNVDQIAYYKHRILNARPDALQHQEVDDTIRQFQGLGYNIKEELKKIYTP